MNTTAALPPPAHDSFSPIDGPHYGKTFRDPAWHRYCADVAMNYAHALGFELDGHWPDDHDPLREWAAQQVPQIRGLWKLDMLVANPRQQYLCSGMMVTYTPASYPAFGFRLRVNGDFYTSFGLNAGIYAENPEAAQVVADFLVKVMMHPAR